MPGRRPPERAEITFSGVPAWLLTAYLVELGGSEGDDGTVHGEGWAARLTAEKAAVGSIALGRVTVSIEGAGAEATMTALRKKAQRGGG